MKKYKIGGNPVITVFMVFWCAIVLGIGFAAVFMFSKTGSAIGLPFLIVPLFMFIFGIVMLINNQKGMARKSKALLGKATTGRVVNFYITTTSSGGNMHHHTVNQMLEVQYKTESGEDAIFVTTIDPRDAHFFEIDKLIPIRVSGEYAYYDIEALRNKKPIFEDSLSSKKIICTCGYSFENGLLYCPKCGKSVEDEKDCNDEYHGHTNFCPACGQKLEKSDKFCRNCGYKI